MAAVDAERYDGPRGGRRGDTGRGWRSGVRARDVHIRELADPRRRGVRGGCGEPDRRRGHSPWKRSQPLRKQTTEEGQPLSERELEVVALVAAGHANRAIAEKLFLSPRTVEKHVEHVMNKLGLGSRAEIAAWYARQALPDGH